MPRDGSHAQNAPEEGSEFNHNIIHGAGKEPTSDKVDRADKTAPLPEHEDGEAIKDAPAASGGQSQGLSKGPNVGQGN